jgi:hypothetical protein
VRRAMFRVRVEADPIFGAEVALSQLIPTFRFEPSEKQEVVWRFGAIVTPSVKGSTTNKPEMPLRVSLVQ